MQHGLDEKALRRLLVAGRGLVSDLELDRVLASVLEAAIEITGARYAALGVLNADRSGLENFIHAGIDEPTRKRIGDLPTGKGVLGILIEDPRPLRLADVGADPRSYGFPPGHPPMKTFLGVPITIRGKPWGNLYLTEKAGGEEFNRDDQEAAIVLAEWAAIAIGNARSIAADRLRFSMEAAEQERLQWARELHDETLQGLAAIRLILATARRGGPGGLEGAVDRSLEQIDLEIASLRRLISDLRPDSLDQLGIEAALGGLAARVESRFQGVRVEVTCTPSDGERLELPPQIAIYRVAQEAITNAIRHGGAGAINVELERVAQRAEAELRVRDDGCGFDFDRAELGFGIVGMQERAELAGGTLSIESAAGAGSTIRLQIPIR